MTTTAAGHQRPGRGGTRSRRLLPAHPPAWRVWHRQTHEFSCGVARGPRDPSVPARRSAHRPLPAMAGMRREWPSLECFVFMVTASLCGRPAPLPRRTLGARPAGCRVFFSTARQHGSANQVMLSASTPSQRQSSLGERRRFHGKKNLAPAERSGLFGRTRLFHWNADVAPFCCRKPATKGRRLLCAG